VSSKKRFDLAVTVHKVTIYQLLSVIARLDEELVVLQGGLTSMYSIGASQTSSRSMHYSTDALPLEIINYNVNTFTGNILFETSIGVKQSIADSSEEQDHHDVWLCVHHYKEAVRDSQESLSILIADYMDVEFHQQILSNKAHNIFIELSSHYVNQQLGSWRELSLIFDSIMHQRMLIRATSLGVPYPDLDSPFTKIKFGTHVEAVVHPHPSLTQPTTMKAAINNYNINYDHCPQQCGLFSFTQLYSISQPKSSCIVLSGPMMILKAKAGDSRKGTEIALVADGIWSTAFALVTIDGFLHIMEKSKYELPTTSYYIKVWMHRCTASCMYCPNH